MVCNTQSSNTVLPNENAIIWLDYNDIEKFRKYRYTEIL